MRSRGASVVGLAAWLVAVCGCALGGRLVGTRIEVTSTQRTLEQQILGAFENLGSEVYLMAGVRTVDPMTGRPRPPEPMTDSRRAALDARRRMEFNRDDVAELLRAGLVGEGADGRLVLFEQAVEPLREADPRRHRLVTAVVAEENADRAAVARRIVETQPDLRGESGMRTVGAVLAARYRAEAAPGARVQTPDGAWQTKGAAP